MDVHHEETYCYMCERTYSRPEHLRRHLASHAPQIHHECLRCRKTFRRKDILRRHLSSCKRMGSSGTEKTYRACQMCVVKKRKCDLKRPKCKACDKLDQDCAYAHEKAHTQRQQCDDIATDRTIIPTTNNADREGKAPESECGAIPVRTSHSGTAGSIGRSNHAATPLNEQPTQYAKQTPQSSTTVMYANLQPSMGIVPPTTSLKFLIDFTKGYTLKGFGTIGDCRTEVLSLGDDVHYGGRSGDRGPPEFDFAGTLSPPTMETEEWSEVSPVTQDHRSDQWYNRASKPTIRHFALMASSSVATQVCEIRMALRAVIPQWSLLHDSRCLDFFSPDRFECFLELYWSAWHPNWPVLHKPTFDVASAPTPLLTAMLVMGACHSRRKCDRHDARYWFGPVEEVVFGNLDDCASRKNGYRKVQAIQGAYIACIYQNWDGDTASRSRMRRYRFNAVVTAMRDIGVDQAKHAVIEDYEKFDWMAFIRTEETIRTLLWVFQLDTAYVIFNNLPPHFALRELQMGLASCEICFQAETAAACFVKLGDWLSHCKRPRSLSLYGLIKTFFTIDVGETALNALAHESFMNLWCINAAFHVVLFNLDPAFGAGEQFARLRIGLKNWQTVCVRRLLNNDELFFDAIVVTATSRPREVHNSSSWKRPGFWKHAAEFWLLAHLMLERMIIAQRSNDAAEELSGAIGQHREISGHLHDVVDDGDMKGLHSFLLSIQSTL